MNLKILLGYYRKGVCSVLMLSWCILMSSAQVKKECVDYVNPYMGNISHLLVPTYPTIHLPNSLLRVYPERADYTGDLLRGLPLIVTSHRGSSAFNLSPFQGNEKDLEPVISYSYDQEKITPYSYSVYLDDMETEIEYAVSNQAALYEMNFGKDKSVYLAINSKNGVLKWDGEAVSGYQSIGNNTNVYIYLKTEQKPENVSILKDGTLVNESVAKGQNACFILKFKDQTSFVRVRYGISFIDEEQAMRNLNREVRDHSLKSLQARGRKIWNLFNSETAFFHPKDSKGEFIEPFDYVFSGGQGALYLKM